MNPSHHLCNRALQLLKTGRVDPMLAAQLIGRKASFQLLDHADDLHLGETARSQLSAPSGLGRLYITMRELPGGQVCTGAVRRQDGGPGLVALLHRQASQMIIIGGFATMAAI